MNESEIRVTESRLLGGEAALWTEYVDEFTVLPRLWSDFNKSQI